MYLRHREILWQAQQKQCWLCGGEMAPWGRRATPKTASIDHVIPRSLGGGSCIRNKRLAHRSCNSARGNYPPDAEALGRAIIIGLYIEGYVSDYPGIIKEPGWDRAVSLYCRTVSAFGGRGTFRVEVGGRNLHSERCSQGLRYRRSSGTAHAREGSLPANGVRWRLDANGRYRSC